MKELILQALSRFLYNLRGLFVEKTELKKYAKKPKKRYIVGRAMALHPMVGDRYFFQTGLVKMRVDKAFVQALAENGNVSRGSTQIFPKIGYKSCSLQYLLEEATQIEKWKGTLTMIPSTDEAFSCTVCYKDGCSIETLTEAVRNGSGELKDILRRHLEIAKKNDAFTAETTTRDLHIVGAQVKCTKTCAIIDGTEVNKLFSSGFVPIASNCMRKEVFADTMRLTMRCKKRGFRRSGQCRCKLSRVSTHHPRIKVVITPFCKGRKGIPEWFFLENKMRLRKNAIL